MAVLKQSEIQLLAYMAVSKKSETQFLLYGCSKQSEIQLINLFYMAVSNQWEIRLHLYSCIKTIENTMAFIWLHQTNGRYNRFYMRLYQRIWRYKFFYMAASKIEDDSCSCTAHISLFPLVHGWLAGCYQ